MHLQLFGDCLLHVDGTFGHLQSHTHRLIVWLLALSPRKRWTYKELGNKLKAEGVLSSDGFDAANFRKMVQSLAEKKPAFIEIEVNARNVQAVRLNSGVVSCDLWKVLPIAPDHLRAFLPCGYEKDDLQQDIAINMARSFQEHELGELPLADDGSTVASWLAYAAEFQAKLEAPAFGMDLIKCNASLLELFVPLRICPVDQIPELIARSSDDVEIDPTLLLANATDALAWLEEPRNWSSDERVVFQGNPGSGKSSLARIFTLRQLQEQKKVLFFPLQRLRLPTEALTDEVLERCLQACLIESGHNHPKLVREHRITVILDALDELQLLDGKSPTEGFLFAVWSFAKKRNWRVLITTRHQTAADVAHAFGKAKRFELLRYFYTEDSNAKCADRRQFDSQTDYRQEWWQQFGRLTGGDWSGLPEDLKGPKYEDLTSEPLNNLMVAIAYHDPEAGGQVERLSDLYERILQLVQRRGFEAGRGEFVSEIEKLNPKVFEVLLQDIAVAAWPNGGRLATMSAIAKSCRAAGHQQGFKQYIEGATYGPSNVLVQFYFRNPNEVDVHERRVEFTHKSFSDWLLVRKLVALTHGWAFPKDRKSSFDQVVEWLAISQLAPEHTRLLHDEIAKWKEENLQSVLNCFDEFLQHYASWGLDVAAKAPGTILSPNTDGVWTPQLHYGFLKTALRSMWILADIFRYTLNHNRPADTPRVLTDVNRTIVELLKQPNWSDPMGGHFRNVELKKVNLEGLALDHLLMDGIFRDVEFGSANLCETVLDDSQLEWCGFRKASLHGTSFENSRIKNSNFSETYGSRTNFQFAEIIECSFANSELIGPLFQESNLIDCDFSNADLVGAEFTDALIDPSCNFEGALMGEGEFAASILNAQTNSDATFEDMGWILLDGRVRRS